MRKVLTGLAIGESPRWHAGRLWLCNWGTGEILAVADDAGTEVMARVATTLPFSIDWLPDGRLLVVSGPETLLLRQEADGSLVTHAVLGGLGEVFNEIVVDGRGNAYDNGGGSNPMTGEELRPGVVVLVTPDGAVTPAADDIAFGNGMAVTPDNRTLIVAESYRQRLSAFDIAADGSLTNRRVWADVGGPPDGICIDADGAVWYADVPNQCCVRVAEGGAVLDTVEADRGCFGCMLGGPDGTTLFIAAARWRGMSNVDASERTGVLLAAEAAVPGAGWPARG
jgi:sugar lactone lactonase YvrE